MLAIEHHIPGGGCANLLVALKIHPRDGGGGARLASQVNGRMFRRPVANETIQASRETILRIDAKIPTQHFPIILGGDAADCRHLGGHPMPRLGFIIAVATMLVGLSFANGSDAGLPGIGTFAYNGSPMRDTVAPITVAAAR